MSSVTVTPLLSYLLFKPIAGGACGNAAIRTAGLLVPDLPAAAGAGAPLPLGGGGPCRIVAFVAALYGFTRVKQSFFPPATRPQFMVDVFLPAGTHIRETEAFAGEVQQYIQTQPGVTHVTSFIGGGGLRFLLVYSPERENRAFVQFLVDVDDWRKIEGLIADIQRHLDERHPNANAVAKKFLLGPGAGGRIQARFRGPDPATTARTGRSGEESSRRRRRGGVRAQRLARAGEGDPPRPARTPGRRNGITRVEVAQALETSFEGRVVGFYREPGGAGTGVFPQETRLLPIVARPPLAEREDVA